MRDVLEVSEVLKQQGLDVPTACAVKSQESRVRDGSGDCLEADSGKANSAVKKL